LFSSVRAKHVVRAAAGLSHGGGAVKRARDQKEVQTTMNKYELALVVDAKIEEEVRVATVEKAKEYVTKFGGTITDVDEWGKKKLAYEIQHMKEGYYYFIRFDAEATVPGQLEQSVRIMDNVLRFLCIRQEA
jgi:small subunit ribosomal protein S6